MKKLEQPEKTLGIMMMILGLAMIITVVVLMRWMFGTHYSEDSYVITRTSGYPPKVEQISKEYRIMKNIQFIPTKAYVKIGVDYFCTIEMTDSSYLTNYTNHYLGNFHYEGLRFHTWQLINLSIDSTFKATSDIKGRIALSDGNCKTYFDYPNHHETLTKFPDTIEYQGLKIYNIEPWSYDKYLEKIPIIYEEPEFEGNQSY